MKNRTVVVGLLLIGVLIASCSFNKSASVDFMTGISTKGDGLSVDDIYLSDDKKRLETTEFEYGQKFYLNFNDIIGFKKENGAVFPGMEFIVLTKENDTVMYNKDLYSGQTGSGFKLSPIALNSNLIVANPIKSNEEYSLICKIWDKKGEGTLKTEMDFNVIPNPKITIENNGLSANEVYLSSITNNRVITNEIITFDEKVQIVVEGLNGFTEKNGQTELDLSMKLVDANGNVLSENTNLLGDSSINANMVRQAVSSYFTLTKGRLKNPVTCHVEITDKISGSKMSINTELTAE